MLNFAHVPEERLDAIAHDAADATTDERAHLASCEQCERRRRAYSAITRALSAPWSVAHDRPRETSAVHLSAPRASVLQWFGSLTVVALIVAAIGVGLVLTRPEDVGPTSSQDVAQASLSTTHRPVQSASVQPSSSALRPTPAVSLSTTQPSAVPVVIPQVVGFGGWSPDGAYFVAAKPGLSIFDTSGQELGTLPTYSVAWTAGEQLAGLATSPLQLGLAKFASLM